MTETSFDLQVQTVYDLQTIQQLKFTENVKSDLFAQSFTDLIREREIYELHEGLNNNILVWRL